MSATGVGVVLVAAGQGTRLGADRPKALVPLRGTPLVARALQGVLACPEVTEVVVVVPRGHEDEFAAVLAPVTAPAGTRRAGQSPQAPTVTVVPGGTERTDSVAAGLAALTDDTDIVLVHDAARPLAPPDLFAAVAEAVRSGRDAVVPALPLADTVKQVDARGAVVATPERSALRAVQTPQGFRRAVLQRAHAAVRSTATDDAALVERTGATVHVIPGDERALKVTTPADISRAEQWLRGSRERTPVLVVLAGLPGVGKSEVARAVALALGAAHLRVDTVEVALQRAGLEEIGPAGYVVLYGIAADQLRLGHAVVADTVNPWQLTREAWAEVAERVGADLLRVELSCSDPAEHRRRVEGREADIEGHELPDWSAAAGRDYHPWEEADLRLDTAGRTVQEVADRVLARLEEGGHGG